MRVLLVDDHALIREGMKSLLTTLDETVELDEAGDCAEALAQAASRPYDLVLLDLKMPGSEGLDALTLFRERHPEIPVVVLSGEGTPRLVRRAIDSGAMGFIPKTSPPRVIAPALTLILAGGVYLPPSLLEAGPAPDPETSTSRPGEERTVAGLSQRQLQVLRCVVQGQSNKVIARELDVSPHTVKTHLSAVFRALGVHNRTEAVYAAAKLGVPLT